MRNCAKRVGARSPTIFFDDDMSPVALLRDAESWILDHRVPSWTPAEQARFRYVGETSQEWVARRVLADDRLSRHHTTAEQFLRTLGSIELFGRLREALRGLGIDPGLAWNPDRVSVVAPRVLS